MEGHHGERGPQLKSRTPVMGTQSLWSAPWRRGESRGVGSAWPLGAAPPGPSLPMVLCVQVEDAVLDTFDLVYHQAVRSPSRIRVQELAAIQDTVSVDRPSPRQWCCRWSASLCLTEWALGTLQRQLSCARSQGFPGPRPRLPTYG